MAISMSSGHFVVTAGAGNHAPDTRCQGNIVGGPVQRANNILVLVMSNL